MAVLIKLLRLLLLLLPKPLHLLLKLLLLLLKLPLLLLPKLLKLLLLLLKLLHLLLKPLLLLLLKLLNNILLNIRKAGYHCVSCFFTFLTLPFPTFPPDCHAPSRPFCNVSFRL